MSAMAMLMTRAGILYRCVECERVFNPEDETDASELTYGHDCEVE